MPYTQQQTDGKALVVTPEQIETMNGKLSPPSVVTAYLHTGTGLRYIPASVLVGTNPGGNYVPIKDDLEALLPMVDMPNFPPPDDEE